MYARTRLYGCRFGLYGQRLRFVEHRFYDWTGRRRFAASCCSTEDMLLDDVLDLNNSDFISIADNGDYIFTKDGEDMTPAHPNIDKVEVTEARINNNFKVEIPVSALTQVKRKSARREKLHTPASVEGKAIEFHYTGTAPYEIRELTSAMFQVRRTLLLMRLSTDSTLRLRLQKRTILLSHRARMTLMVLSILTARC